jgi:hypothetical protein
MVTTPGAALIEEGSLLLPSFSIVLGCVTITDGSQAVDETLNMSGPESSPADSWIWISRIMIAVVLGEAIWGFLVSITNNLVRPAMARVMGGDPQFPLYLGKGEFNVQALFISVLELCFAGIMAVLLNSWSQKTRRVRPKAVRLTPVEAPPAPVVAPPAVSPATPADTTIQAKSLVTTVPSAPQPTTPSPQIAKSRKPTPPKVVYYNIVGEPVDPDDQ